MLSDWSNTTRTSPGIFCAVIVLAPQASPSVLASPGELLPPVAPMPTLPVPPPPLDPEARPLPPLPPGPPLPEYEPPAPGRLGASPPLAAHDPIVLAAALITKNAGTIRVRIV
jgi:hypothetical protein